MLFLLLLLCILYMVAMMAEQHTIGVVDRRCGLYTARYTLSAGYTSCSYYYYMLLVRLPR